MGRGQLNKEVQKFAFEFLGREMSATELLNAGMRS